MTHTKKEIIEHFSKLPIEKVWNDPNLYLSSLENVEMKMYDGRISFEEYQAYCVIWRNTITRYSTLCAQYEF